MSEPAMQTRSPWSRFAHAFRARRGARFAWRALLLCVGLAVFAPLLANERPLFARFRDVRGYEQARQMLVPIAERVLADSARTLDASWRDDDALRDCLDELESKLERDGNIPRRSELSELRVAVELCDDAARRSEPLGERAVALHRIALRAIDTLRIESPMPSKLREQTWFPVAASLSMLEVAAMLAWIGIACFARWPRFLAAGNVPRRLARLALYSIVLGLAAQLPATPSNRVAPSSWKERVGADPRALAVFTPIAFGPGETDLSRTLEAPFASSDDGLRHGCGTDALGRDLLARMLYAGRTSFAVAFLAALLITLIGATLGLAAGALRGIVDGLVSRGIELLQAFPTLVLLLGLILLLPASAADSRWSVPLLIGCVGWAHVARLARAEALRVGESGYVQAAIASGIPRARVIWRHVLPNSLGPIWIAASFVLSAGLVLESAAAFLGFGVQPPTPSFGALLEDARAAQAWWLALFPGLWMFSAILAIHLVGEGVRDALDPRDVDR
ncbi:MAG TPA: ABC transporter permease [Planctomycetota bacterium]|nr:ABC transporter permease [Planctomycetota bacterium]